MFRKKTQEEKDKQEREQIQDFYNRMINDIATDTFSFSVELKGGIKMNEEIKEVEKEIAKLQDKLAMLKSKKVWKPEEGETYWFIYGDYSIYDSCWDNDSTDNIRYSTGNCYKTKADAEFALEKQKLLVAMQRYADERNEEEIDWENDKPKFYIYYNYRQKIIYNSSCTNFRGLGQIYFTSKEIAENCVKEFTELRIKKYLFGGGVG
jgi:hypothetical protein